MNEAEAREDHSIRYFSKSVLKRAPPKRMGVAVSGGGDSMALLVLMFSHGAEMGIPVEAVTVDHGLRAEAADEAVFVAGFCTDLGIPHKTLHWRRASGAGNIQAEARDARYRLIAEWAKDRDIDCVALGHTMDDQAETFLMRLARKSGVDGLSAMEPNFERNGIRWVRPLLGRSRTELRGHLKRQGIQWIEDPTNEDREFERVKARDALTALAPLGIESGTLARVSHQMSMAKQALEHYVRLEAETLAIEDCGDVILKRHSLPPVPAEIDRRLVTAGLQWVGGQPYPPRSVSFGEMEAAWVDGSESHTMCGCRLTLARPEGHLNQKLRITREYNAVKDLTCPTDALWDGRWAFEGPHTPDLEIRALGEAVKDCPNWHETGLPRISLLASPAVWHGEELIAAPVAGFENGWTASATGRGSFTDFLIAR